MKKLTAYGLAFLLFTGTSAALAGRGDRDDHGRRNDNRGHYNNGGHHYNHYSRGHRNHYYRGHRNHHYYRRYSPPGYYYPSYLGAVLMGSALSTSLYNNRNGEGRYDDRSNNQYQGSSSSNREVVGCHRIEILADGSEQRVEVPMSQCN